MSTITQQLKRECVPDPVNWNNAMAARHHAKAEQETFDVGKNELGMGFDAQFNQVKGRRLCVLTPVQRTFNKGKVETEQKFTHMRKARWFPI